LSAVLDANVLIVLALDRRRAVAVEELLRTWKAEAEELHAPALLRYEVANALTQAVSAGHLASGAVTDASQRIGSVLYAHYCALVDRSSRRSRRPCIHQGLRPKPISTRSTTASAAQTTGQGPTTVKATHVTTIRISNGSFDCSAAQARDALEMTARVPTIAKIVPIMSPISMMGF
jgi:hypothetical protein